MNIFEFSRNQTGNGIIFNLTIATGIDRVLLSSDAQKLHINILIFPRAERIPAGPGIKFIFHYFSPLRQKEKKQSEILVSRSRVLSSRPPSANTAPRCPNLPGAVHTCYVCLSSVLIFFSSFFPSVFLPTRLLYCAPSDRVISAHHAYAARLTSGILTEATLDSFFAANRNLRIDLSRFDGPG